jgi:Pilus formation protein N terminal region
LRKKNLIAGSICLAVLPCFALFAVAQQQRPAAQQPAASQQPAAGQQPAAAQQVQPTHYITMPPGFSIRYESPRPFASVVSGNTKVAEAVPGPTDRVLVITSKPDEGQTNFLLVDRSGQEVANVAVTVAYPEQPLVREPNKVVVHNKLDNLAGYTNYICNPICIRVGDPNEGGDRVPVQNLSTTNGTVKQTIDQTLKQTPLPPAPAGTSP